MKGIPQKLRALELSTLSLMTLLLTFPPLRHLNSKLSGTQGQILDLLLLSSSGLNKKKNLTSASHSHSQGVGPCVVAM